MSVETFEAIGTKWQIELPVLPLEKHAALLERIRDRIDIFDRTYSRFKSDSLVADIARTPGLYQLSRDAKPMFDLYYELYKRTAGKFTPLIGQVLSDAGYDAQYSLKPKPLSNPPAWDDVLIYDFPQLTIHRPVLLDFGAGGKGYLVDLVSEMIEADLGAEEGFESSSYSVNAGGDIRIRSSMGAGERIGLEHPDHPDQVIGVVHLKEGSICGSAGNRRAWRGFNHTIDPDTLTSPKHIKAIWVSASTTLLADALTTCLYFVAPNLLRNAYNFEYLIVYEDLIFESSSDFPAELFTSQP